MAKPREVSLESPSNSELSKVKLPKDEKKPFDENDDIGTSNIPDLSIASEEEETPPNNAWDHACSSFEPFTQMGES